MKPEPDLVGCEKENEMEIAARNSLSREFSQEDRKRMKEVSGTFKFILSNSFNHSLSPLFWKLNLLGGCLRTDVQSRIA